VTYSNPKKDLGLILLIASTYNRSRITSFCSFLHRDEWCKVFPTAFCGNAEFSVWGTMGSKRAIGGPRTQIPDILFVGPSQQIEVFINMHAMACMYPRFIREHGSGWQAEQLGRGQ